MRPLRRFVAVVLLLGSFCGCSRQKTLSRDDLRSHLTQAISYAAETELFLDLIAQRRATADFAKGHAGYLRDEINQSLKELLAAQPGPADERVVRLLQEELRGLSNQLSTSEAMLADPEALAAAKLRVASIRETLERARVPL